MKFSRKWLVKKNLLIVFTSNRTVKAKLLIDFTRNEIVKDSLSRKEIAKMQYPVGSFFTVMSHCL